jgi:hypothetical protein
MKKTNLVFKILAIVFISSYTLFAQNIEGYNIRFGKIYRLQNVSNTKVLEVEDGLFNKGIRVQQYWGYTSNGSTDGFNQEWVFIPGEIIERNGQTIYLVRILNYGFLDYLTNNSGKVQLAKTNPGVANLGQFWEVSFNPTNGNIRLRSHVNNQFLQAPNDANDGSEMGLAPQSPNLRQEFKLISFSKDYIPSGAGSGPFTLKPAHNTNLALDVTACGTADNTLLNAWTKGHDNTCQQFQFLPLEVGGNLVRIQPVIKPDFKIRLQDINSKAVGANIVIGSQSTEMSNVWIAVKVIREPGKFFFINILSGLCMEVWNARRDPGATIGQNLFTNGNHQKWIIE